MAAIFRIKMIIIHRTQITLIVQHHTRPHKCTKWGNIVCAIVAIAYWQLKLYIDFIYLLFIHRHIQVIFMDIRMIHECIWFNCYAYAFESKCRIWKCNVDVALSNEKYSKTLYGIIIIYSKQLQSFLLFNKAYFHCNWNDIYSNVDTINDDANSLRIFVLFQSYF